MNEVSVKEQDFLEQDDPIRGQNYVCMSFISPEDVIKSKESYFIKEYMKKYTEKNKELIDGLCVLFPDKEDEIRSIREQYDIYFDNEAIVSDYGQFKIDNEVQISEQYSKENNFQTNIRGVKVRGIYDSLEEAKNRAALLKRKDNNKFNIYIGQVGCWCPWSVNPNEIENAEYSETQLNTMMKEYNKNKEDKELHYNERKNDMMKRATENNKRKVDGKEKEGMSNYEHQLEEDEEYKKDIKEMFSDQDDPWAARTTESNY